MSSFANLLTHPRHVAVGLAGLLTLPALASSPAATIASPVRVDVNASAPFGVVLQVNADELAALSRAEHAQVVGFPLSQTARANLSLDRFEIFAPDAIIVEMTDRGEVRLPVPEIATFSGTVIGDASSSVYLSVLPGRLDGIITLDGLTYVVSSGPMNASRAPAVYRLDEAPDGAISTDFTCFADQLPALLDSSAILQKQALDGPRGAIPCRRADVAIDTDVEYRQLLGGTTPATNYAGQLLGAVSEIFTRDLNLRLRITFLRIWSGSAGSDPWDQGDTISQLYQFQDYWNLNETGIARHTAHYLSGRGLGGGVAYLPGLCYPEFDYGLSANLGGSFPYPIQNNSPQNWDLMVVAHELGHIVGAPHTHDMDPPVDGCAFGDCSVGLNGTIMSYCHLCSGGLANVRMEFHSRTINEAILPHLDGNAFGFCDLTLAEVTIAEQPEGGEVCEGGDIFMDVTVAGDEPITYQWRKDLVNIPGANTSVYYVFGMGPSNVGSYDVVCTGPCGSVTSAAAVVTLAPNYSADLDGDCDVDLADLSGLLESYGLCQGDAGYNAAADLDGDNCVTLADLSELLGQFGSGA